MINDRRNKEDGALYCEYSGKMLVQAFDIVAHHKTPLTMQNVNDFNVSLNPENIMIVSQAAHNEIHARFGYVAQRKVYLVYGAPCSGKTTFVDSIKGNSDLVVDMDNIWACITGGDRYEKPDALKVIAFNVRDCLLDMVKTRAGKWEKAYIITGAPRASDRRRYIDRYGAELIHIDTDKEECLKRLYGDCKRQKQHVKAWAEYINQYFADFQE
ncbi:MAG: hypothetical protein IKT98_03785 [Selenomonadaceae bacterium]|nr:hypothetical protein [Selenomonadaceae bacterium]